MGGVFTRRNENVEEVEISGTNAYRYPPKSGCYFGSHFIMGGEKFETTQPESYLFGENNDLNFLGNRPAAFPYPPPQAHEPTKTLKSLVNIRKDSLRFVKVRDKPEAEVDVESGERQHDDEDDYRYNIEFTFDCDVRVAITVYYFATEEIGSGQAVYHPRDATMNSETYHYKRGANQTFTQAHHVIQPNKYPDEDWQYSPDKDHIPIVIQCVVQDEQHAGHSHASFAAVERASDGGYTLKALKQKQVVDGLCYLLQEIYGIENKSPERQKLDDELDDNGSECVICMCESRDTLILPCRHLCLCNFCADNLRYQANNCPICRAPFRALLQIRAMRKKLPGSPPPPQAEDECPVSQEGVPTGYEAVSLIEALNGPQSHTNQPLTQPLSNSVTPALPPDDNPTGNSPALKRKHKRSSGRSSRHSRRAAAQPVLQPQANNEDATALVAMAAALPSPPPAAARTEALTDKQTDSVEPIESPAAAEHRVRSDAKASLEDAQSHTDIEPSEHVQIADPSPPCPESLPENECPAGQDSADSVERCEDSDAAVEQEEGEEAGEGRPLCPALPGDAEQAGGHSSASSYSSTSSGKGLLDGAPAALTPAEH